MNPEFPVDLPSDGKERSALGWAAVILGVAAASLALTDASSIESWGAELAPGPRVAALLDDAGRWSATTDRAGLGTPRAKLHRWWKQLEEAHWTGEAPAAQG